MLKLESICYLGICIERFFLAHWFITNQTKQVNRQNTPKNRRKDKQAEEKWRNPFWIGCKSTTCLLNVTTVGVATPLFIRSSLIFVTFTSLAVIWELWVAAFWRYKTYRDRPIYGKEIKNPFWIGCKSTTCLLNVTTIGVATPLFIRLFDILNFYISCSYLGIVKVAS